MSYSVGGPADILARSIAEKLSVKIEQSVIVQNVLGAGGILGAETEKPIHNTVTNIFIDIIIYFKDKKKPGQ